METILQILQNLVEAPLPDPTPTPTQHPETDPKRTRNRPETEPNGAKRTRTEPNGAELDRNQAPSGGTAGGVCRDGGGGGCKGKRTSLAKSIQPEKLLKEPFCNNFAYNPLWWAILGLKISRKRGRYEESGRENDKETEEDKKPK